MSDCFRCGKRLGSSESCNMCKSSSSGIGDRIKFFENINEGLNRRPLPKPRQKLYHATDHATSTAMNKRQTSETKPKSDLSTGDLTGMDRRPTPKPRQKHSYATEYAASTDIEKRRTLHPAEVPKVQRARIVLFRVIDNKSLSVCSDKDILTVKRGDIVQLIERKGEWYLVSRDNAVGLVLETDLREIGEEHAPPLPPRNYKLQFEASNRGWYVVQYNMDKEFSNPVSGDDIESPEGESGIDRLFKSKDECRAMWSDGEKYDGVVVFESDSKEQCLKFLKENKKKKPTKTGKRKKGDVENETCTLTKKKKEQAAAKKLNEANVQATAIQHAQDLFKESMLHVHRLCPDTSSVPEGYISLAEGHNIYVPITWLTDVQGTFKNKTSSCALKLMMNGFFHPNNMETLTGTKLAETPLGQAIKGCSDDRKTEYKEMDDYTLYEDDPYDYAKMEPNPSDDDYITAVSEDENYEDMADVENIYENVYKEFYYEYIYKVHDKLRIVILGKTGSGKSSTANSLIKKTGFKAKASSKSVTRECSRGENVIENDLVSVVDTPGLFDTDLSYEEIKTNIVKCITLSFPGPHVFMVVLQIGRFTDEEIKALDQLFEIFGHSMEKYAILIFTRYDDLQRDGTTIEEYIADGGDILKKYIDKCKGGYFAVNNVALEEEKEKQTDRLIARIQSVVKNNNNKHYTNEMFEEAKKFMKPLMQNISKEEYNSTKREIEACEARINEKKSQIKRTKIKILEKIEKYTKTRDDLLNAEKTTLKMFAQSPARLEERHEQKKKTQKEIGHLNAEIQDLYNELENLESTYVEINDSRNAQLAKIKRSKKEKIYRAIRETTEDNLRKIEIMIAQIGIIDQQIDGVEKQLPYAQSEEENTRLTAQRDALIKEKISLNNDYIKNMLNMSDALKKKIVDESGKRKLCKVM